MPRIAETTTISNIDILPIIIVDNYLSGDVVALLGGDVAALLARDGVANLLGDVCANLLRHVLALLPGNLQGKKRYSKG